MIERGKGPEKAGIRFLGEMTALFSHDIKNVLAIINENAGLLQDLSIMAANGPPLDPEKMGTIASKIQHQIRRADEMVKRLNLVGHSMDCPMDKVQLAEMVETVSFLAARKADQKAISLSITPPDKPVAIRTDPFALQQLIWICIDQAIRKAGSSNSVEIFIKPTVNGASIIFGFSDLTIDDQEAFLSEQTPQKILEMLNADLVVDPVQKTVSVDLPAEISA
jgi:signal transduction histidine kinase